MDDETYIHEGEVKFTRKITIPKEAEAGKVEIALEIQYQACDDQRCLAPKKEKKTLKLAIAG